MPLFYNKLVVGVDYKTGSIKKTRVHVPFTSVTFKWIYCYFLRALKIVTQDNKDIRLCNCFSILERIDETEN